MWNKYSQGVTVVEILIGVSLFALIVVFVTHTLTLYFVNAGLVQEKTKALYLAEEGQEVMRYLRDENWDYFTDLTPGDTYYLEVSTSTLTTTMTNTLIEGLYTRSVVITQAYRDDDNDLVTSGTPGASVDSESFIITTTVSWGSGESVQLEGFLSNIFNL